MNEDAAKQFANDMNNLIRAYAGQISNIECLGILKLMSDDISQATRKEPDIGPSPLS